MLNQKHKYIYILIIALISTFCSCQRDDVYFEYQQIKTSGWDQNQALVFEIDSTLIDPSKIYSLSIEIDNNVSFPYTSLWVRVDTDLEEEGSVVRSEKECILANKLGRWVGVGTGFIYSTSFPYKGIIKFNKKRKFVVSVRHGMTDQYLIGIERLGLRLRER